MTQDSSRSYNCVLELLLEKCLIRPWRAGDEESLVRHANNRNVWRNLRDIFPSPYTMADARAWIAATSAESPQTNYAIEVEGEAAGGIGLALQRDVEWRSAEIGFWLGEELWGRGIMSEAVRAFTECAFLRFDLCRVYARVFEWNAASGRVLERAGYVFEGRLRKSATKDGRTIDQLMYAATIND